MKNLFIVCRLKLFYLQSVKTNICVKLNKDLSNLQVGDQEKKYQGLLEKKWTSVIRLQKKVLFGKTFYLFCKH